MLVALQAGRSRDNVSSFQVAPQQVKTPERAVVPHFCVGGKKPLTEQNRHVSIITGWAGSSPSRAAKLLRVCRHLSPQMPPMPGTGEDIQRPVNLVRMGAADQGRWVAPVGSH